MKKALEKPLQDFFKQLLQKNRYRIVAFMRVKPLVNERFSEAEIVEKSVGTKNGVG